MKQILKTVSKYEFHRPPVESLLTQHALDLTTNQVLD